jgi:hypothetical protein
MVASVLARLLAKGLAETGKKSSSEVAKKGSELIGRRGEKFMGAADEVTPPRLSGPAAEAGKNVAKKDGEIIGRRGEKFMGMADEVTPPRLSGTAAEAGKKSSSEVAKKGSEFIGRRGVGAAAGLATGLGAIGAANSLIGGKKESNADLLDARGPMSKDEEGAEDVATKSSKEKKVDNKSSQEKKVDNKSSLSSFGAAFKKARDAGEDVFTYDGKKYTTEVAGEKKSNKATPEKQTGVREGRNQNIDDDTRKRAMDSVASLNKGGFITNKGIGASMKPHDVFGSKRLKK